jgi:hypothetical protein
VTAIALYIGAATAGKHIKCSVYDSAGPPRNHVAVGCDSVDTVLSASPTAYVTMATTGTCHLAASTRYWIACTADDNATAFGRNTQTCTSCWQYVLFTPYSSAWPATLTTTGNFPTTISAYMLVTPQ